MQIQVSGTLLALCLFCGCDRLSYSPLKCEIFSDVKNECVGLWNIDESSTKYLREKNIRDQWYIPPDRHFIWMFDDGKALVHCSSAFYDKEYRYLPSDEDTTYAEMYGAVTSISNNSPKRFHVGAYGVWDVLDRSKTCVNWRVLDQPSEWYWGVDICTGGRGMRLYLGEDENGPYLAVPIYIYHYGYLRDFIRLRKIDIPLSESKCNMEYPLIKAGYVSEEEHFSSLTNQFHIVLKHGLGKRVDSDRAVHSTKYYIYDELFDSNFLQGMNSMEEVCERVSNTPIIQRFKSYVFQNFGVMDVAVVDCPTGENGVRLKRQCGKEAFWITVVIPDDMSRCQKPIMGKMTEGRRIE